MGHKKQSKPVHRPGSLADRRPISPEAIARFDQIAWETDPERYAARTWKLIKQWAEA